MTVGFASHVHNQLLFIHISLLFLFANDFEGVVVSFLSLLLVQCEVFSNWPAVHGQYYLCYK